MVNEAEGDERGKISEEAGHGIAGMNARSHHHSCSCEGHSLRSSHRL